MQEEFGRMCQELRAQYERSRADAGAEARELRGQAELLTGECHQCRRSEGRLAQGLAELQARLIWDPGALTGLVCPLVSGKGRPC